MSRPREPLVKSWSPAAGAPAADVAAGGAEWVLFTDWCAVAGHDSLPATAETVLMFFGDCPAAAGTFARRLSAIDAALAPLADALADIEARIAELVARTKELELG